MKMDECQLMRTAEYVAIQCTGCSDLPQILAYKAFEVMKDAAEKNENPYKALSEFLGTDVSEEILKRL